MQIEFLTQDVTANSDSLIVVATHSLSMLSHLSVALIVKFNLHKLKSKFLYLCQKMISFIMKGIVKRAFSGCGLGVRAVTF